MAYFNDTINFLKPLFISADGWDKTLLGSQLSFGRMIESNLITSLQFCEKKNYIRVQNTNEDYNTLFGADAMVEFDCPMNFRLNKLSVYIDITLENKPNKIRFNGDKPLCRLSNGLDFAISFKPNHSGFFKYRKPIIILELRGEGFKFPSKQGVGIKVDKYLMPNQMLLAQEEILNPFKRVDNIWKSAPNYRRYDPIFNEKDISNIVRYLRQASLYLSYDLNYEYQGVEHHGTCKYASTEIDLNKEMIKNVLATEGGSYYDSSGLGQIS